MRKHVLSLAIVLSASILYIGSYLVLVEASLTFMSGVGPWPRVPKYMVGGKAAEIFFAPIQKLDERLRPQHWQYP
jgi:hypothetical protein